MGTQPDIRFEGINAATIVGELVAPPELRTLPSGSTAASFSLTVRITGRKTTSVPLVWYDPPKRMARWAVGDIVVTTGPVVRRFYQAGGGVGSSTEVVVETAVLARDEAAAQRVFSKAQAALASLAEAPG